MLKFLIRLLAGLAVLVLLAVGAAYFVLQDPNRFKPEIEAFIQAQTGAEVEIGGDLTWQLFPPLALSAAGIRAEYEGNRYTLESLQLDLDLMSVIRSRDTDQWQVKALRLSGLTVDQEGEVTRLESLVLRDFKPATPSPFQASLTQRSSDGSELPLTLAGLLAVDPDARRISLTDTRFRTTQADGTCEISATVREGAQPPDPEGVIIPVSIWRSVDWSGECLLDRLTLEEEDFRDVRVTLANAAGVSTTQLQIPDFFDGSAEAIVDIDASADPVRWRIVPDLARADSTAVMAWLDQRLKWIAPLALAGEITMTGNTEEELIRSVKGKTTFDGGQGRIDIARIKKPLLDLATLFREPDRIAAWPELWRYQKLAGEWLVDGTRHELDFALDNLKAEVAGDYDPLTDALDMKASFRFEEDPELPGFDVNPVLVGLPIPLTCTGTLEAPKCSVTKDAARNLVAAALTSEEGSDIRKKIDQKIEEEVPEQYREAARGFLELLGESLKRRQEEKENAEGND